MALIVTIQVDHGMTYRFDSNTYRTIKIGRLPTANIRLEHANVARIHAVLEISATEVSIVDMGSAQGVLLNGQKINKALLHEGDTITIGDALLHVSFGQAVSAEEKQEPQHVAVAPAATVQSLTQVPQHISNKKQDAKKILPEEVFSIADRVLEMRFYIGDFLFGMFHYFKPKIIRIGENKDSHIFLSTEGLPTSSFPLIRFVNNEYLLSYTSHMQGEAEIEGKTVDLKDLYPTQLAVKDDQLDNTYQLVMKPDTRALLHWGGATFAMRFVAPPVAVAVPFFENIDFRYLNSLAFSFFLHLIFIIFLALYPRNTDTLAVDLFGEPDRFANLILQEPKDNKSLQETFDKIKKSVDAKKDQIKTTPTQQNNRKEVDTVAKSLPNKGLSSGSPKSTTDKKVEISKRFNELLGGASNNLLGGGGAGSLSGTLQNVIGSAGAGSASASLVGLGIRGSGPLTGGGIGTSQGIAGIDTTGKMGIGGARYGSRVGGLGKGRQNMIDLETPTVEGALSADAIKRVINQNKKQIRYCYEIELQHDQSLEGRIQMKWIIGATGEVLQVFVKDSTITNSNVEKCLMEKIKHWKFPPPAGGGTVEVNYPFVFKAS